MPRFTSLLLIRATAWVYKQLLAALNKFDGNGQRKPKQKAQ